MAETMALTMEGRYEDYSIGRELSIEKIEEIEKIATKHGFRLAGLRSFEQAVTPEAISHVLESAMKSRKTWKPVKA